MDCLAHVERRTSWKLLLVVALACSDASVSSAQVGWYVADSRKQSTDSERRASSTTTHSESRSGSGGFFASRSRPAADDNVAESSQPSERPADGAGSIVDPADTARTMSQGVRSDGWSDSQTMAQPENQTRAGQPRPNPGAGFTDRSPSRSAGVADVRWRDSVTTSDATSDHLRTSSHPAIKMVWPNSTDRDAEEPSTELVSVGFGVTKTSKSQSANQDIGVDGVISEGRRLEHQGKHEGAIAQYEKALEIAPKHRAALLHLARLHHRIGDLDRAIRTYQRALQAYQEDAMILNDLGLCLARRGNHEAAAAAISAAVQIRPESDRYVNNLAHIMVAMGERDEAFQQLERRMGPSLANFNLAVLLQKGGETNAAVDCLKRAIQLDPQFDEARSMLRAVDTNSLETRITALPKPESAPISTLISHQQALSYPSTSTQSLEAIQRPTGSAIDSTYGGR